MPPTPPPPPADALKERLASEGVALTGMLLGQGASYALSAAVTLALLYFLLISERWIVACCVVAVPRRRTRALLLGGMRSTQREIASVLGAMGPVGAGDGLVMPTPCMPSSARC
jgi:hypothetical protein